MIFYGCNLFFRGGQTFEMNIVSVYDIQNKFIAYTAPYPDVINVLCEWGSVYILSGDRKVSFRSKVKGHLFNTGFVK